MITLLWLHLSAYLLFSSVDWSVLLHPPKKTTAQRIPHKLSQILLMLSILLLLIPLHCLFISALSCMGKLDWFGFQGWQTGKLESYAKCLGASHKLWHRQMARAGSAELFDFRIISAASFLTSGLVIPFLLLHNVVTSTSVFLWPVSLSWSKRRVKPQAAFMMTRSGAGLLDTPG